MESQDLGLIGAVVVLATTLGIQFATNLAPSLPGAGGAVLLSVFTGASFWLKSKQHEGEAVAWKKLLTTVIVAAALGALTGRVPTDESLQAAMGGGLGTSVALILENVAKALTKPKPSPP